MSSQGTTSLIFGQELFCVATWLRGAWSSVVDRSGDPDHMFDQVHQTQRDVFRSTRIIPYASTARYSLEDLTGRLMHSSFVGGYINACA